MAVEAMPGKLVAGLAHFEYAADHATAGCPTPLPSATGA
jgi:hypothetical protein